jgi:hypothetical protein
MTDTNPLEDLPTADSDQTTEAMEPGKFYQVVSISSELYGNYEMRYDGEMLVLMQPVLVQIDGEEEPIIGLKSIGHFTPEESLPFPLDFPSLERWTRILITQVNNPEADAEEEAASDE